MTAGTGAPADNRTLTQLVNRTAQRIGAFDKSRPLVWDLLLAGCLLLGGALDVAAGGWRMVAPNPDVPLWPAAC
ncbi:hypothetical protein [Streptomyces niveus]|uniref:hypothetical protein n=1 Tax=Streptomyces niveus TaxID=193462 RepID=UPI00364F4491